MALFKGSVGSLNEHQAPDGIVSAWQYSEGDTFSGCCWGWFVEAMEFRGFRLQFVACLVKSCYCADCLQLRTIGLVSHFLANVLNMVPVDPEA